MNLGRVLLALTLVALVAPPVALAQATRPLRPEQEHAWDVVETLAEKAGTVADDATRLRVIVRIADLLWERDPARGRKLFRRAFDESDDLDDDPRRLFGGPARRVIRAEIIQRVYRRDPAFAKRLSDELDDLSSEPLDESSLLEGDGERGEVLVQVAIGLAATDPQAAAELGRMSLQDGVSVGLPSLLAAIAATDRQTADALAVAAIDSVDPGDYLAMRLFFLGAYAVPDLFPTGLGPLISVQPNPAVAAQFLQKAYQIAERLSDRSVERDTGGGTGQDLAFGYLVFSSLVAAYDRYLPELSPAVRALTGRIGTGIDPDVRTAADDFLAPSSDTPEALVRQAESTLDPAARERLYVAAARMAMARGTSYDDVKDILAKLPKDSAARAALTSEAAGRAARRLAASGLYEDALRAAADVTIPLERANVLVDVASRAAARGDRARASEILEDALRVIAKADVALESDRALALARIAGVFVPGDSVRGFDVIEDAVKAANTATRQVASPQESARAQAFKPAELDVDLAPAFEALGRVDFFRALLLAQAIDDRALALLSQLAVARGAIRNRVGPATEAPAPRKKPVKKGAERPERPRAS